MTLKARSVRAKQAIQDQATTELQDLTAEVDQLVSGTGGLAGRESANLREQINPVLHRDRDTIERTRCGVVQRSQAVAEAIEEYIRDHPWQTIAVSAGAGFLFGSLVDRRQGTSAGDRKPVLSGLFGRARVLAQTEIAAPNGQLDSQVPFKTSASSRPVKGPAHMVLPTIRVQQISNPLLRNDSGTDVPTSAAASILGMDWPRLSLAC